MPRTLINFRRFRYNDYRELTPTHQKMRTRIKKTRDELRDQLDTTGSHSSWAISDIGHWNPYDDTNNHGGYAFIIQHREAGVPSGHEWLVIYMHCPATNYNTPYFSNIFGQDNTNEINTFFRPGNLSIYHNEYNTYFHYNNDTKMAKLPQGYNGTKEHEIAFTGSFTGTPTIGETLIESGGVGGSQMIITKFNDDGSGNCHLSAQLIKGKKPTTTTTFDQSSPSATFTISTIEHESFYDFGFDNWAELKYSNTLKGSGITGTFSDNETVTGATSGETATYRRTATNDIEVIDISGPFEATGEDITGNTSGAVLTFTGVIEDSDFKKVASNPYDHYKFNGTNSGFMSKEPRLKGQSFEGTRGTDPSWIVGLFDSDKPFISFMSTYNFLPIIRNIYITGNIISPHNTNDDLKSASYYSIFDVLHDTSSTVNSYLLQTYSYDYSYGTVLEMGRIPSPSDSSVFSRSNSPRNIDGKYPWALVEISNNEEFKGWFDSDIIRQLGPGNEELYATYVDNADPFIKLEKHLSFPWGVNIDIWPPIKHNEDYH